MKRAGVASTLGRTIGLLILVFAATSLPSADVDATDLAIALRGTPRVLYDPAHQACAPIDVPDMNPRVFRDVTGGVTMFALHFVNRPLRGPDLTHVKIDCHIALDSPLDADPAHYANLYYVASTWTMDGRNVNALIHHEYHADAYKRCSFTETLACWYNTILAFHSNDGGETFTKARPFVVAAAPFTQDVGQGRHRGFFEPSNMFEDGGYVYVFSSTTGWEGQDAGSCLFRTRNPADPALWRAYDGTDFTIQYVDPYRRRSDPKPCKVIEPFVFSVGSVVYHARSKTWLAVFQASAGGQFPIDGFYYATTHDLLHWSPARLLRAGQTLYGDWCKGDPTLINYPSVLDPQSRSRNFDRIGDRPLLFYTTMQTRNCQTLARLLLWQPLDVDVTAGAP